MYYQLIKTHQKLNIMTTITLNNNNLTELNDDAFARLDAMIEENTDFVDADEALEIIDAMIELTEDELKQQIIDSADSFYTFDYDVKIEKQTEKALLLSWVDGYKKTTWIPKKAIYIIGSCNIIDSSIQIGFEKWFLKTNKNLPTNDCYVDLHQQEIIDSSKILTLHKNSLLAEYAKKRYLNINK